ncbi:MAG: hypothetical protein AAB214_11880, partial [Fibrobacterota bacterium]
SGDNRAFREGGSILSRDSIQVAMARVVSGILQKPDRNRHAQVRIGFAVTRFLPPAEFPDFDVHKANEKVVVGLEWLDSCPDSPGSGCYRAWSEPFGDLNKLAVQPVLWFGPTGTDSALIHKGLVDLALASASFPVAFPPMRLRWYKLESTWNPAWNSFRPWSNGASRYRGEIDATDSALVVRGRNGDPTSDSVRLPVMKDSAWGRWDRERFVKVSDGGMFENQPLQLGLRIFRNQTLLGEGGAERVPYSPPDSISSIRFVIPTHYPTKELPQRIRRGMNSEWIEFLLNRNPGASELEMLRGLEDVLVDDTEKVVMNTTSLPLASEHFLHFSGFFQERFRKFDFLVGYLDGLRSPSHPHAQKTHREFATRGQKSTGVPWLDTALQIGIVTRIRDLDPKSLWQVPGGEIPECLLFSLNQHAKTEYDRSASGSVASQILSVLQGSLNRLEKSNIEVHEGRAEEDDARFNNFSDGLPSKREGGRWNDADQFYLAVAKSLGRDGYGAMNSWLYPVGLYHARQAIAGAFGQKPIWMAPSGSFELCGSGFRLIQGFTIPKFLISETCPFLWQPLMRMRWEIGAHPFFGSGPDDWAVWQVFRTQMEFQPCNKFSILPSVGWEYGITRQPDLFVYGLGGLVFDAVGLRVEQVGRGQLPDWHPTKFRYVVSLSTGFNLFAIAEGLRNGTDLQREMKQ